MKPSLKKLFHNWTLISLISRNLGAWCLPPIRHCLHYFHLLLHPRSSPRATPPSLLPTSDHQNCLTVTQSRVVFFLLQCNLVFESTYALCLWSDQSILPFQPIKGRCPTLGSFIYGFSFTQLSNLLYFFGLIWNAVWSPTREGRSYEAPTKSQAGEKPGL